MTHNQLDDLTEIGLLSGSFLQNSDGSSINVRTPSQPVEFRQDWFDKQPVLADIHGAPPTVTIPTVINHIRNLYDHMKRLVDWVNEAAKAEENAFPTRLELKHDFSDEPNKYATPQYPDAVEIFLHADPYTINLSKLPVYEPTGQSKIGFERPSPRISTYKDEDGFVPKRLDGEPLETVIISHINLADIRRQLQANEFQLLSPMIQQGFERNASYLVKMVRENLVASVFSKLPVYTLADGTHVNESRVIQEYISKKMQELQQQQIAAFQNQQSAQIEAYNNRRPMTFDHRSRYIL